ncbi:cell wall-active antibiotics response protein LiaF [Sporosarcina sp. GW1-11]|uniref:cell wall-active antibiotics response protein LiaF n=1 Tax=Sporosarcina sp. GW1-11 TaxID=2899126 RepID=UPI00294DB09E|nr:cell wall-active antibiotics response protein LiaF [Sporosarcina sp. GW1-11]MDV6379099.1 cell wall-active antibiotics response protein LiaF [Sporosarcina sp. GW1-11]
MTTKDSKNVSVYLLALLMIAFIESIVFSNGNVIFLLLGWGFLDYGYRKREKWTVISGAVLVVIALLTLWSVRLLVLAIILYILVKLWKGTPASEVFGDLQKPRARRSQGLWRNRLFSIQSTPFSSYEWEDVHIQGFFGDVYVDVTDTVLPKGASFISIRQIFGKIIIELPYDIPVRIHYATLYGGANLLAKGSQQLFNETVQEHDGYETKQPNDPELIITIFTWIGDVEVRRK